MDYRNFLFSSLNFLWDISGTKLMYKQIVDSSRYGYKIVKSTSKNPVYPGNSYLYISNSNQTSATWSIKDGQTYYFRVCQYLGGKCGTYSNSPKSQVQ